MPAAVTYILLGVSATYLGLLAFFYFRGRQGRTPSTAASIAVIALTALLGVVPTEVLGIIWITLLQGQVEVTANLFILVPMPVVAAMIALHAFALSGIYRPRLLPFAALYLGVYAAGYAFFLSQLFNPPADIARYVVIVLVAGAVIFSLFWRLSWRHRS